MAVLLSRASQLKTCFFAILCIFATNCFAGVAEYNDAMSKGDFAAAAIETQAVWEGFDKTSPSAATLAREFAYVCFMAQDFEKAKTFLSHFNADHTAPLQDDEPDITRVLIAAVNYRLDQSPENRQPFIAALKARIANEGTDAISIMTSEFLYVDDGMSHDWKGVQESALLAMELVSRAGEQVQDRVRNAQVAATTAAYIVDKSNLENYKNLVVLHNDIINEIDQSSDPNVGATLMPLKWKLHAWIANAEAMHTEFKDKLDKQPSEDFSFLDLKKPAKGFDFANMNFRPGGMGGPMRGMPGAPPANKPVDQAGAADERAEDLPLCHYEVNLKSRNIRYPSSSKYRGDIGTVLFRADVNAEGEVSNAWPLSSVPEDNYTMMAGMWGNSLEVIKDDERPDSVCRLNQKNAILPVSFRIQRVSRPSSL